MTDKDDRLEIFQGDITTLDVDAVVNAANAHLEPVGREHLEGESGLKRIVFAVFGAEAETAYRRVLGH